MNCRTDLAIECTAPENADKTQGVSIKRRNGEKTVTTDILISTEKASETAGKPVGRYITVEVTEFSNDAELFDERFEEITACIKELLPDGDEPVLVAGLGNDNITPDALGPVCVNSIFSTRHLSKELLSQAGLENIKSVCALSAGVLGQTGMETGEILQSVVSFLKPRAVIVIDALACAELARLGKTVQLTDTGITPGSGVGNSRKEISRNTLGVPVIAVGVPTVVDALTIAREVTGIAAEGEDGEINTMMVTPRDIDTLIHRASRLIALCINSALQPSVEPELLLSLV